MGVLVFLLAVIQMTGGSNMNLLRAESPGPRSETGAKNDVIQQEFYM